MLLGHNLIFLLKIEFYTVYEYHQKVLAKIDSIKRGEKESLLMILDHTFVLLQNWTFQTVGEKI